MGGIMTFGREIIQGKATKQKTKTKKSIEIEVVGASN